MPQFNAILKIGSDQQFVLTDASGQASSYLRVGGSFKGYTIKAYDPKTDLLEVEHEGASLRLPLVADARVKATEHSDRHMIEVLLGKLPAFGVSVDASGKKILAMGRRGHLAVGDKFTVHYQDKDYELQLVAFDEAKYTVRSGEEEYSTLIVPSKTRQ